VNKEMRTQKSEISTYQKIIKTAMHIFAKKGYHETSIRDIIKKAGIKQPTLYYHFGCKEDLYKAILETTFEELYKALEIALKKSKGVKEKLKTLIHLYFSFTKQKPDLGACIYSAFFSIPRAIEIKKIQALLDKNREIITEVMIQAKEEGMIRKNIDMNILTYSFMGLINIYISRYLIKGDIELDENLERKILEIFLKGTHT
jgi:AcrR family transcriptional regulator